MVPPQESGSSHLNTRKETLNHQRILPVATLKRTWTSLAWSHDSWMITLVKCFINIHFLVQINKANRGTWRLSNHDIFENKRFSSFFANGPIKFRVQLYATVKNFKSFELTWSLKKQHSNSWMLVLHLQKTLNNVLLSKNVVIG